MPAITLYVDSNFISPYAMACFVTLVEKQLSFDLIPIDIDAGAHLRPPFSALAPIGRVPLLVHGEVALNESSAIIEYLEEAFPAQPRVLPADLVQRAKARQVQAWLRSDLGDLRSERSTVSVFIAPCITPLSAAGQAAADRLIASAERLIDGEHLCGAWSVADADLALMLKRLINSGDAVPERLAAYANAQWQRPSVQQWVAKRA
jgi:glutathione S-transferase